MSYGSQSHNTGIEHLNLNNSVACKSQTAHMYVLIDKFRVSLKPCKRCLKVLAKMDASAAKKAARLAVEAGK